MSHYVGFVCVFYFNCSDFISSKTINNLGNKLKREVIYGIFNQILPFAKI
jgi:hypothetical protein